ncbi:hypothetical protein [Pseudactinotalea suaedae]|uniref:hypothetical protein n=1 Tax=Pseudactinotalea suaedae TaxID=1524924 RepID=UPI0012E2BECA|nr:hypothetical protein [Pseudactinotalea suaedae]
MTDVVLDVDLERVPACEGFTDQTKTAPCLTPAQYLARMFHRGNGDTCRTALMCEQHLLEQLHVLARIEASPFHRAVCEEHLLPVNVKAVRL